MSDYTTVSIPSEKKETVSEAQDVLEERWGFRPRKGDVVVHAVEQLANGR